MPPARVGPGVRALRAGVALAMVGATLGGWQWIAAGRRVSAGAGMAAGAAAARGPDGERQRLLEAVARQPAAANARLELARYFADRGRPAEAAWEHAEAAALAPGSASAPVGLAGALGQIRLSGVAVGLLKEELRRQPRAIPIRIALAEQSLATGRPERAAALLAADGVPRTPETLLALGRAHLALGRLSAARSAFEQHLGLTPGSAEGHYWLGRLAWIMDQAPAARRSWERGADLAPGDPRFPYCLAMACAEDPAPDSANRAGQAFEEALRRSPGYVPALVQLGRLYQRHGRHQAAAAQFLKAIDHAPTDPEPHRRFADALAALGEKAEAHRQRGLSYSLSDQPLRAIEEYERFQALDPENLHGPLLISQSYIQMRRNDRASSVVQVALQRHPGDPALRERLVTLFLLTHSRVEAEQVCRAWLQEQPDAARPYWLLGRVAAGNRQVEEALDHFETAAARDPARAEYLFSLGTTLVRQAAPEAQPRALSLLRRAVDLEGDNPEFHHQFGVALQQAGRWEEARREFLAALTLDPDRAAACNNLAQVAQALRRPHQVALWAKAMRAAQERLREERRLRRLAGQHPGDPSPYIALARALLQAGRVASAHSQLEQALTLRPNHPEARRLMAQITALRAVV
jgi:tetratricopeptide (TPR) repeat protein